MPGVTTPTALVTSSWGANTWGDGLEPWIRTAQPIHRARRANANPLMLQGDLHLGFPCAATRLVHGDHVRSSSSHCAQQTLTSEDAIPDQGVCKSQQTTIRTSQRLRRYFAHEISSLTCVESSLAKKAGGSERARDPSLPRCSHPQRFEKKR